MPAKQPRKPKPKEPRYFQRIYWRTKQAKRQAEEARKAAFLTWAETYPDVRDELMAIYEKAAGKITLDDVRLPLVCTPANAVASLRRLSESVKKRPPLPKRKGA